jgi:hypothetical protein
MFSVRKNTAQVKSRATEIETYGKCVFESGGTDWFKAAKRMFFGLRLEFRAKLLTLEQFPLCVL